VTGIIFQGRVIEKEFLYERSMYKKMQEREISKNQKEILFIQ
jgi:hypothetical protein